MRELLEKIITITYNNEIVYKKPFFLENTSLDSANIPDTISQEYDGNEFKSGEEFK